MGTNKSTLVIFALLLVIFMVVAGGVVTRSSSNSGDVSEITVSAAASLTESFTEVEQKFEEEHPKVDVILNLAGSGTLRMQVEAGVPIDVFASASQKHMDMLDSDNLIVRDTRHDFAENSLVMIVPVSNDVHISSLGDLVNNDVTKIAIGDPAVAPVGKYTKNALEAASIWDDVDGKLIYTESVKQVLVYVENGEVDVGFVYLTDALSADEDLIDVVVEIPVNSSISYPIAIVSSSENSQISQDFIDYVISDAGKDIFVKYGFTVMDDS